MQVMFDGAALAFCFFVFGSMFLGLIEWARRILGF